MNITLLNSLLFYFFSNNLYLLILLCLILFLFFLFFSIMKPNADAVHPHDNSNVLNMMHMLNVLTLKVRKYLFNSLTQKSFAFFLRVSNHKAINVNQWHFVCLHILLIVSKYIQKLDGIDWKVHVDMIRILKLLFISILLSIYLSHCLTSAHIPAFDTIFHFVELAIGHKELMAVRIQVICNNIKPLSSSSHGQRAHSTKDVSQKFATVHHTKDSISFLLQSGTPIYFLKVKFKLNSLLFQFDLIIMATSHMLQSRSTIDIMQFLCFVYNGLDVRAFQQSDLSDHLSIWYLLIGEIVMSHMTYCFKTIREGYEPLISLFFIREPFQYLLVFAIFIVQLYLNFLNR